MEKRYFTVAEANALVPHLEAAFGRVLRVRSQLSKVSEELEALGEPLTEDLLRHQGGSTELAATRAHARSLVEILSEELRALEALGVEVKDPASGLCDFVTQREGRDVYLCWCLGEKRVGHWHELTTGFRGRQPLDGSESGLVH